VIIVNEKCGYCSSSNVLLTEDENGTNILQCGECGKEHEL